MNKITLTALDIVACVTILGCLASMAIGTNGTARSVLMIVVGYYFGQKAKR